MDILPIMAFLLAIAAIVLAMGAIVLTGIGRCT